MLRALKGQFAAGILMDARGERKRGRGWNRPGDAGPLTGGRTHGPRCPWPAADPWFCHEVALCPLRIGPLLGVRVFLSETGEFSWAILGLHVSGIRSAKPVLWPPLCQMLYFVAAHVSCELPLQASLSRCIFILLVKKRQLKRGNFRVKTRMSLN